MVKEYKIFQLRLTHTIIDDWVFTYTETFFTKKKSILSYVLIKRYNSLFDLIILCKSSFDIQFINNIGQYNIKIEKHRTITFEEYNKYLQRQLIRIKNTRSINFCKIHFATKSIIRIFNIHNNILIQKYYDNNEEFFTVLTNKNFLELRLKHQVVLFVSSKKHTKFSFKDYLKIFIIRVVICILNLICMFFINTINRAYWISRNKSLLIGLIILVIGDYTKVRIFYIIGAIYFGILLYIY